MTPGSRTIIRSGETSGLNQPFLDYELPLERIALRPCYQGAGRSSAATGAGSELFRSDSRLLVLSGGRDGDSTCDISDRRFAEIAGLFQSGDLLLLNNTRVVPYRFFIPSAAGRPYELFLTGRLAGESAIYTALAKPLRRFRRGRVLAIGRRLRAEVLEVFHGEDPALTVRLFGVDQDGNEDPQILLREEIDAAGSIPIPPYIRHGVSDELDRDAYQTVYAQHPGSVAAPTAGLHFTPEVLDTFRRRGLGIEFVTLHLGPASFQPVRGALSQHRMPSENFRITLESARAIIAAKAGGRRIIAVGTSTVRTVESIGFDELQNFAGGEKSELSGTTGLFITPGFKFSVVDSLVTNFHQPGSTHLLLVDAFAGSNTVAAAYRHALDSGYRFLSYGDSMVIV